MFGERRYHKCEVGIYAFNEASIALHRKIGFRTEGRLRDHEYFAGGHHDLVVMGLTIDELSARYRFADIQEGSADRNVAMNPTAAETEAPKGP